MNDMMVTKEKNQESRKKTWDASIVDLKVVFEDTKNNITRSFMEGFNGSFKFVVNDQTTDICFACT